MKVFNVFFCIVFVLSAVLQYNDPDPYLWIPIYLYAALGCWLVLRKKYLPQLHLAGLIIFGTYAIYLFFSENGVLDWIQLHNAENIAGSMKATKPWIEETREFFGLMIGVIVFSINYFYSRKMLHTILEKE